MTKFDNTPCYSGTFWKDLAKVIALADSFGAGYVVAQDEPYIGFRIMRADEATDLPIVHRT